MFYLMFEEDSYRIHRVSSDSGEVTCVRSVSLDDPRLLCPLSSVSTSLSSLPTRGRDRVRWLVIEDGLDF